MLLSFVMWLSDKLKRVKFRQLFMIYHRLGNIEFLWNLNKKRRKISNYNQSWIYTGKWEWVRCCFDRNLLIVDFVSIIVCYNISRYKILKNTQLIMTYCNFSWIWKLAIFSSYVVWDKLHSLNAKTFKW